MDEITRGYLNRLSEQNPGMAITFTHQFLDGKNGRHCGMVPDNWNGVTQTVIGQWWRENPKQTLRYGNE
jgi:hypothetical protein